MPVYKLLEEMPNDEFITWQQYFSKFPPGWREDDRTAKLLQAQGVKLKPEQMFNSLAIMKAKLDEEKEKSKISVANLKGSALFSKMMGAKGGTNIADLIK